MGRFIFARWRNQLGLALAFALVASALTFLPARAQADVSATSDATVAVHFGDVPTGCTQVDRDQNLSFRNDLSGGWVSADNVYVECGAFPNLAQLYFSITITGSTLPTALNYSFPSITMRNLPGTAHYVIPECMGEHGYSFNYVIPEIVNASAGYSTRGTGTSSIIPSASDGTYRFYIPSAAKLNYWDRNHGKCNVAQPLTQISSTQTRVDVYNDVATLDYVLDEPENLTGQCTFDVSRKDEATTLTSRTWTGYMEIRDQAPTENVICGDTVTAVPGAIDPATPLATGQRSNVIFRVPSAPLVDVSLTVTENVQGCLQKYPSISVRSNEGLYAPNVTNNRIMLPRGTWTFSNNVIGSMCDINQTVYVGSSGDTQSITLSSALTTVDLHVIQPSGRSDCIEDANPFNPTRAGSTAGSPVALGASSFVALIKCGSFTRKVQVPLTGPISRDGSTPVDVNVPDIQTHVVSGSFSVPPGYRSAERSQVRVLLSPVTNPNDDSQEGWASTSPWNGAPISAALDWTSMTYSANVPTGRYNISIEAVDIAPARGCYATSYFAGAGHPDVISSQFADALSVGESPLQGAAPTMNLKLGAYPSVVFDWPASVPEISWEFGLFNSDKQLMVFKNQEVTGSGQPTYSAQYNKCLLPGTYYLRVSGPLIATTYSGGSKTLASASPIVVGTQGTVADTQVKLVRKNSSSICGTLSDPSGDPVPGFTIYSTSSTRIFSSAQVATDGTFCLTGLESPGVYSLLAASRQEFSPYGTGGTAFAYYGDTDSEESSNLVILNGNISDLKFVYTPANSSATPNQVLPWNRFASPNPPVATVSELKAGLDAGTIGLDETRIVAPSSAGIATIDSQVPLDGDFDTFVDAFIVSAGDLPLSSLSTQAWTQSTPSRKTKYLGKVSIVGNRVVLPGTVPVAAGLNQIVLVSNNTKTKKSVPLVAGLSKPINLRLKTITGTFANGKTLTAPINNWAANPSAMAYSYKWQRCRTSSSGCTLISGATASTYKVKSADRGKYLNVIITARNSRGSTSVTARGKRVA